MNPRIAIVYIDSGGGHRAAANALCEVIGEQRRPWDVRLLSIQEMLDSIDFVRKSTGIRFQEVYNIMLRRGWTLGSAQLIPLMHLLIRMSHPAQVRVLRRHWSQFRPDLVVSLIPHYNRSLKQSLEGAWPGTPYVTILTDIADYPPHFWIERQDQYVICGSGRAAVQARLLGLPASRILRASGMILHPRFYSAVNPDRAGELARLGLHAGRPTGLVLFGGEGSLEMVRIARALNRARSRAQLILLCGRHQRAAAELRAMHPRIPMFVEGFTRDIPRYMELADFFIGKPGPGCISEALAKGLPVIVERNAWTLAHERFNADWVEEQQVGVAVGGAREIPAAVERLLDPDRYPRFRARALATRNAAVYEIPALLERILAAHRQAPDWSSNPDGARGPLPCVHPSVSHNIIPSGAATQHHPATAWTSAAASPAASCDTPGCAPAGT
jgi:1,2-diacylglycerol 3-beta-galactosyltransferase